MAKRNIKNLPEHERPREKLIERGAVALTDHELLAVLIGKGSRRHDAITLAKKMIPVIDEKGAKLSIDDLAKFDGIGNAKAALILAAVEFSRRRIRPEGIRIETPADLVPHIRHYVTENRNTFSVPRLTVQMKLSISGLFPSALLTEAMCTRGRCLPIRLLIVPRP